MLADALGCGRRQARALLRSGRVRVDGRHCSPGLTVEANALVEIAAEPRAEPEETSEEPKILWQTDDWVALSKPAGMHTHYGRGGNSAAAFLERRFGTLAAVGDSPEEAGIVHRLDRDTSGVLLAAIARASYQRLRRHFAAHEAEKHYLALVCGRVASAVEIDTPLARRRTRVTRAHRRDRAMVARTRMSALEATDSWSLVTAEMRTGVTHQVRAHLSMLGHPLIGDIKYGGAPAPPGTRTGHLLHALRIRIDCVADLSAAPPQDFLAAYARLRNT